MIALVGDSEDPVLERLCGELRRRAAPFALVDESVPSEYSVDDLRVRNETCWRVRGRKCSGRRPIGAVFVRHASRVPRGSDRDHLVRLNRSFDLMLSSSRCCVINRPSRAGGNYSKPLQLLQLAHAGFLTPRTLITSIPIEAKRFIVDVRGCAIFKGISSVKTLPQAMRPDDIDRLDLLDRCPTQFQEGISGQDVRVTVVGRRAVVTRIVNGVSDFRSSDSMSLPRVEVERCVRFARQQGLVVAGFDLRQTADGRVYAFEMNPYPLFTHFEDPRSPQITRLVARYLLKYANVCGDVRM